MLKTKFRLAVLRWIESPKKRFKIVAGSKFETKCIPSGNVGNVEWQKLDDDSPNASSSSGQLWIGYQLSIERVLLEHKGVYQCKTKDESGQELIASTYLDVLGE